MESKDFGTESQSSIDLSEIEEEKTVKKTKDVQNFSNSLQLMRSITTRNAKKETPDANNVSKMGAVNCK